MARLFMDGFEHGKPSGNNYNVVDGDFRDSLWQIHSYSPSGGLSGGYLTTTPLVAYAGGAYSAYATRGRNDGGAYSLYYNCLYKQLPSTHNKLYTRMYFRSGQLTDGVQDVPILSLDDTAGYSASQSMQLRANIYNDSVALYVNGVEVSRAADVIISDTWHLVECMYNSSGSNIIVKIDGSILMNYSGTIDGNISYVSLFHSGGINVVYRHYMLIDDFAINDDSGIVNNSWIGAGVIRLLKPTSDDTNADFVPNTGSNHYALVDDFPDDGDATYNGSSVSGDIDTFGLQSVPSVAVGQTINAVQAVYRARSQNDAASVAPILISGATTDTGATQSTVLSDYNDTKQKVYDVDPNGSIQWTEANVNALKGGYKNAT